MAQLLMTNPQITINSVDLSGRIDQLSLEEMFADVDTTTFGSGSKTRIAGLGDHKVTLALHSDVVVEITVSVLSDAV